MPTLAAYSAFLALAGSTLAAGLPGLEGRWLRVPERSADVARAIEGCIAPLNFVARPIARARLAKTNRVPERLELRFPGDRLSVRYVPGREWASPAAGTAVPVSGEEGKAVLTTRMDGAVLVQRFQGEDGDKENRLFLGKDGLLVMETRSSSPRLPAPLAYRTVFRREP